VVAHLVLVRPNTVSSSTLFRMFLVARVAAEVMARVTGIGSAQIDRPPHLIGHTLSFRSLSIASRCWLSLGCGDSAAGRGSLTWFFSAFLFSRFLFDPIQYSLLPCLSLSGLSSSRWTVRFSRWLFYLPQRVCLRRERPNHAMALTPGHRTIQLSDD
jgi:hypothetical protein